MYFFTFRFHWSISNRKLHGCIAMLWAHKLVVMTATAAMRRVRAGTRAAALLLRGSIVLQSFVSHLESKEVRKS